MKQLYMHGFEISQSDHYERRLSAPLDRKIEEAVDTLRMHEPMALRDDPDHGYHLAYSGGKDSDVILELAKMAGVKFKAVYNVTTIDPPELIYYIRSKGRDVTWSRPEHSFFHMLAEIKTNGPPTRLSRWCCEIYKESGGKGKTKIIGVRSEESRGRKARWRTVVAGKDGATICPIVYWTDDDVWAFHSLRGIDHCCLYDEGFKRLGCVGCPMSSNRRREFDRWPGFERQWRRAVHRFWDRLHGTPNRSGGERWFEKFGGADGLWAWWMREETDQGDECQTLNMFQ
jgi:phosphoadenosine phosphosulfate reductase